MLSISDGLIVLLMDTDNAGYVDGSNVLRYMREAETAVIDANWDRLATGNADLVNRSLTPSQRRNILHTEREEEFVDNLLIIASRNGTVDLFGRSDGEVSKRVR